MPMHAQNQNPKKNQFVSHLNHKLTRMLLISVNCHVQKVEERVDEFVKTAHLDFKSKYFYCIVFNTEKEQ